MAGWRWWAAQQRVCCAFNQPFIAAVWLGPEYLLDERLMMLIVLYFFSWMFRIMQLTYRMQRACGRRIGSSPMWAWP